MGADGVRVNLVSAGPLDRGEVHPRLRAIRGRLGPARTAGLGPDGHGARGPSNGPACCRLVPATTGEMVHVDGGARPAPDPRGGRVRWRACLSSYSPAYGLPVPAAEAGTDELSTGPSATPVRPRPGRMGEHLASAPHPAIDTVIASSAVRSITTAEAITAVWRRHPPTVGEGPGHRYSGWVDAWAECDGPRPADAAGAVIVGHEPTVSVVLTDSSASGQVPRFPPSSIAVFRLASWDDLNAPHVSGTYGGFSSVTLGVGVTVGVRVGPAAGMRSRSSTMTSAGGRGGGFTRRRRPPRGIEHVDVVGTVAHGDRAHASMPRARAML